MQIEKKIGKSFLKIAGADAKMHFFYFNFFIDLIYCVVFSGMHALCKDKTSQDNFFYKNYLFTLFSLFLFSYFVILICLVFLSYFCCFIFLL